MIGSSLPLCYPQIAVSDLLDHRVLCFISPLTKHIRLGVGAALLDTFLGLRWIPLKCRYLIPPQAGTDYLQCQGLERKKKRSLFLGNASPHPSALLFAVGFNTFSFFMQAKLSGSNPVPPFAPGLLVARRSVWELCHAQTG